MSLFEATLKKILPQDQLARAKARERLSRLTMPFWALGRLMDLAEDLAGISRSLNPPVARKAIVVMAADHGVAAAEGVSKYPQEVTGQMVKNFVAGGAGINVLARLVGAQVVVVDLGVASDLSLLAREGKIISKSMGYGTGNIACGPAMSRQQALQCLEAGVEVALELAPAVDLFGTGDMGIGNTTPSSAIIAALGGFQPAEITGRGTGIDDQQWRHKVSVVQKALEVNQPDPTDPLDVLAKVGGFEIGGIAGLILGAASVRKPVLVDGFISTAAALVAQRLSPQAADYMIAAHRSMEQGHRKALEVLGKKPLLDLDLRLGEGTGAALAMNLVEAAVRIMTEMATFEEAKVSQAKG
ncbi:MAG: nicotinate-nucleotide--dimethylbenzimidazole phosphoribosyltransferase [bacterium]|nr:nicotinate-nucleotide--dimethylbenzimidazole phosphoribosyltransferase [bacterium]